MEDEGIRLNHVDGAPALIQTVAGVQLDRPKIREQQDVGCHVAHLIGAYQVRVLNGRTLGPDAKSHTCCLRRGRQSLVDGARSVGATCHRGDDEGEFDQGQKAIWEGLLSQPIFRLTEEEMNAIIYGVKDWIDKDNETAGIYGAEDSFYLSKGYRCKNGHLAGIEEMLLVNGVTEDVFYGTENRSGLRFYFTVYGDSKININTAPVPVLVALSGDMSHDIALAMDSFRRDETNKTQLKDEKWYRKLWPFENPLPEALLTTTSNAFSVHIRGTLQESAKEIRAVLFRSDDSVDVVCWREM